MNDFETALAEVFEVESVSPGDVLQQFECWDSLTILSILALADSHYKVSLTAAEVINCVTVENLVNLIQAKANGGN
jgi:acyl carrier protein